VEFYFHLYAFDIKIRKIISKPHQSNNERAPLINEKGSYSAGTFDIRTHTLQAENVAEHLFFNKISTSGYHLLSSLTCT